jgi:hypothetical protein
MGRALLVVAMSLLSACTKQPENRDIKMASYIADTSYDEGMLLGDWNWLLKEKYSLWFVTKFGDAFLKDKTVGSIAWLNVSSGSVTTVAPNETSFLDLVKKASNAERWLMTSIVDGQAALGMIPGKDQCISYIIPPILGGKLLPDNLELTDVAVHLSIAGQIHRQVKDLPPGTKISGIEVVPSGSNMKSKP